MVEDSNKYEGLYYYACALMTLTAGTRHIAWLLKIPSALRLKCGTFQYFQIKARTAIYLLKSPQSSSIGPVF